MKVLIQCELASNESVSLPAAPNAVTLTEESKTLDKNNEAVTYLRAVGKTELYMPGILLWSNVRTKTESFPRSLVRNFKVLVNWTISCRLWMENYVQIIVWYSVIVTEGGLYTNSCSACYRIHAFSKSFCREWHLRFGWSIDGLNVMDPMITWSCALLNEAEPNFNWTCFPTTWTNSVSSIRNHKFSVTPCSMSSFYHLQ